MLKKFEAIDEIAIVAAPGALDAAVQTGPDRSTAKTRICRIGLRSSTVSGRTTVTPADIKGSPSAPVTTRRSTSPGSRSPTLNAANGRRRNLHPAERADGRHLRHGSTVSRGVHKAPANEAVRGALGLEYQTTKDEQGSRQPRRHQRHPAPQRLDPGLGCADAGGTNEARRLSINVRRLMNFLRESIDEGHTVRGLRTQQQSALAADHPHGDRLPDRGLA